MEFRVATDIARAPPDVFAFLRDVHRAERDPRAEVPVLELTTPGPVGEGSRFHEVVRVLPFALAHVESEVTRFEPPSALDYRYLWKLGPLRMHGTLAYRVEPRPDGGSHLEQRQTLEPKGLLGWFRRALGLAFGRRLEQRLAAIKAEVERGR